jgi:hypothetical protein
LANGRIKRPAYQWYPADADSDEVFKLMTYEQEGVYRRLLDHQWLEGSIPADPQIIASLLPKMPRDRFVEIWPLISAKFRPRVPGRLVNDKLESQRRELDKFVRVQTAKSRKGVIARRLQAKNPQPAGQPVGQPVVLPETVSGFTSSSSSSSSSSSVEQRKSADADAGLVGEFSERYPVIYSRVRSGAHYRGNPVRDYPNYLELARGWPSLERLEKMLEVFLLMPAKDANNVPGTPGQFLNMAPHVDALLRKNGQ